MPPPPPSPSPPTMPPPMLPPPPMPLRSPPLPPPRTAHAASARVRVHVHRAHSVCPASFLSSHRQADHASGGTVNFLFMVSSWYLHGCIVTTAVTTARALVCPCADALVCARTCVRRARVMCSSRARVCRARARVCCGVHVCVPCARACVPCARARVPWCARVCAVRACVPWCAHAYACVCVRTCAHGRQRHMGAHARVRTACGTRACQLARICE